jgi:hypothetical protein
MYLLNRNHTKLHENFRSQTQIDKRKNKIACKCLTIGQMEFIPPCRELKLDKQAQFSEKNTKLIEHKSRTSAIYSSLEASNYTKPQYKYVFFV